MKTEILKVKGDWQEVVDDCRETVGKGALGKEPSVLFKQDILIAEHGPIRDLIIKWRWQNIKSWIATHWSRHKWECSIQTQREDRTGIPRDCRIQAEPITFRGEANAQNLIDTMRKRLCHQASPETRAYAEDFKAVLHDVQPELSDVLVPNCVYRCGCPEIHPCRQWDRFCKWCRQRFNITVQMLDIKERYALYNEWLKEAKYVNPDSLEET